jgi:hypothetical protein
MVASRRFLVLKERLCLFWQQVTCKHFFRPIDKVFVFSGAYADGPTFVRHEFSCYHCNKRRIDKSYEKHELGKW